MSEQAPAPVPVDPRKKALASALASRIPLRLDEADLLRMAHQVMLDLNVQGYRVVSEDDHKKDIVIETEMRYADLLSDAHATICLLLEKAGGEVEVEQTELTAARARRYSMVTVTKPGEGTVVLAAFRPPT